ncbi:TolC family outer membrane protein [Limnobacter parvus]|uniref:TolC family outer membrane protein n=1 Tax=Limnobacter parvus TaxID=2939690 RepID=A0ABT1XIE3_9BURK|nr:TolC family outer membrane protein [Limnobacter parvus]MCR2745849.1 TolC family outer membrane protein [Limnobacter parvus]
MTQPDRTRFLNGISGFKGLALVFVAMLCPLGMAQPPAGQNLESLYEKAKQHDAIYLAAAFQLQADLESENQAFSALLPNVNFGARLEKQENTYDAFGMSIDASRNPGTYSLVLNQALFRPQAWESYKQSQLAGEIAKLAFQQAEQDLILRLSRAYFDLLAAQDDLANLRNQQTAITEQLAFAKASFDVGSATITDQQEAQARFDLVVAQLLAAENQQAIRQLQLETIVGTPIGNLAKLPASTQLGSPTPNTANAWADQAKTSNPQALQAKLAQQIAKGEAKKAKYGHLPTLDLTAQMVETEQQIFDGNTGRPFDLGVDSTTVGIVMNLPIFSGGGTQSKVRQQAALLEKSLNDVDLANRSAEQAAKSAFLGVQTSLAQVKALETAVASSALALQSNKTAYEVGIRINVDVLNAQQQLNATQRDLSRAKYTSLINMLELQAVTGQLNAAVLRQINNLLEK